MVRRGQTPSFSNEIRTFSLIAIVLFKIYPSNVDYVGCWFHCIIKRTKPERKTQRKTKTTQDNKKKKNKMTEKTHEIEANGHPLGGICSATTSQTQIHINKYQQNQQSSITTTVH